MPRRIDQVQLMTLPRNPHRLRLDRDAALALEVHRVEQLRAHVTIGNSIRELQDPVGQRRLPMVDVGDNREVADPALVHGNQARMLAAMRFSAGSRLRGSARRMRAPAPATRRPVDVCATARRVSVATRSNPGDRSDRGESTETATRPADELPVHFGLPVRELVLRARVRHVLANRGRSDYALLGGAPEQFHGPRSVLGGGTRDHGAERTAGGRVLTRVRRYAALRETSSRRAASSRTRSARQVARYTPAPTARAAPRDAICAAAERPRARSSGYQTANAAAPNTAAARVMRMTASATRRRWTSPTRRQGSRRAAQRRRC